MRFRSAAVLLSLSCFVPLAGGQSVARAPLDLDVRIALNVARLTDLSIAPAFTEDFLLADVQPRGDDPRRFYNFSGDLSGRYIEVMSLVPVDKRGVVDLDVLVDSVLAYQRPDGRFGDPSLRYAPADIGGEHMALLWGNGRLLVGLMTYYEQTGDAEALAAAARLGDFFIATAAACREPAAVARLEGFGAKGIICFTQYIEGLVMLARATDDERYAAAAVDAYTVLPPRGEQHSHGYLSTLRGVLDLYALTQNPTHLAYVRATTDDLLDSPDHTRFGAVMEYFGGHGDRDEGCSSADFTRLLFGLYDVTGEARYLNAATAATHNALLYNQYASGDFGHHYLEAEVLAPSNPRRSWWCCTMHGLRALLLIRDEYAFPKDGAGARRLDVLLPQTLTVDGGRARLTHASAADRWRYTLRVEEGAWPGFTVGLPEWATDLTAVGGPGEVSADGSALVVGALAAGQEVTFSLVPRLGLHPVQAVAAAAEGQLPAYPTAPVPETPTPAYLTLGPYVLGAREDGFVAEPDWANQVSLEGYRLSDGDVGLEADYYHAGYPGTHRVTLVPVATQLAAGHPYMRVVTEYGREVRPRSPDE